jgi:flagellin-like hook-associated protein FlgL
LSVPSLHSWNLGGVSGRLDELATGGSLAGLDGNTSQALRVVDEAIAELDKVAASVDGFYNASVSTSSRLLQSLEDELQTAIQEVDGYDENEEALLLAKNQELAANALAGLSIIADQRASLVRMIQTLAGIG